MTPILQPFWQWVRESAQLPFDISTDILKHLSPEEKRELRLMGLQHGLKAGAIPMIPILFVFIFKNWWIAGIAVLLAALTEGYLYVSTKHRTKAFLLTTFRSKEMGYSARRAPSLDFE